MAEYDFQSANKTLITWKKSFDDFLKNNIALNPRDMVVSETGFGKEVEKLLSKHSTNATVKNLDFQYKKIIHIATDIQHLRLVNDDTLPDWLEDELGTVFQKINDLLATLEKEFN
ncbi:hypothetical protein OA93_15110 [Flavobacterium sp. KMS]|uniref:hypothetical protein n=1 Tax=Flavobacterium sp. KMS TaxID=1566023 RepID=UPI00057E0026|nr:hypothetical protein [Flavobacterium sp. KMS]KIA97257.1 hypothetical protein OA93_15110 [Flavobacterium sp. KMS]